MADFEKKEDAWNAIDDSEVRPMTYESRKYEKTPQNGAGRVNHPSHYCAGGVECIEGIKAALGSDFVGYCQGNVLKYVWRWKLKGGVEDLKKAQVYLGWMIESVEGKAE